MKKLTKVAALLLASAAIFMGCKNNPEEPEHIPGEWTDNAEFETSLSGPYEGSTLTVAGKKIIYDFPTPWELDESDVPEAGCYRNTNYPITNDTYKGFKATIKSDTNTTYPGFIFYGSIDSSDKWSYYEIIINPYHELRIEQKLHGTRTTLQEWTKYSKINDLSEVNEVIVYTDDDGNIGINVNGKTIARIEEPVLQPGFFGIAASLNYDDWRYNKPIKTTYEFTEFQLNQ